MTNKALERPVHKIGVDNSGGGNCGPYSIAVALIDIIQKQHRDQQENLMFDSWVRKGLKGVSLTDILSVDLTIPPNDKRYNQKLFNRLQLSLREILFFSMKNKVDNAILEEKQRSTETLSKVEAVRVFGQFLQVVYKYRCPKKLLPDWHSFNPLSSSNAINKLAQSIKWHSETDDVNIKNAFIKNKDLILKELEQVLMTNYWLDDSDLKEIADELGAELFVQDKMDAKTLSPEKPVITVRNHGNYHWTTVIEWLPPAEKYKQHMEELKEMAQHMEELKEMAQHNLFSNRPTIEIENLDKAEAMEEESDEHFALRLQHEEFKRAGFK